ncbi:hypothetical protein [Streptomyces sp. NPDC059814]|uniref:hypothetical protein n=1 Tax=unclassified Streptomyces TaxID=2593676 RepID=UPI00364F9BE7
MALRIRPAGGEIRKATAGAELPTRRPLAEWPADQDEPVQFWLFNLPATFCTLQRLSRSPQETAPA